MDTRGENQPFPQGIQSSTERGNSALAFARHVHNYLQEFVRSSDQKAAFLLIAGTALFGLIYKEKAAGECLKWVKLIALILDGVSVLLSVWAVTPRQQNEKSGLIAWEGILADKTPYRDRLRKLDAEQLADELLNHCERLAGILHRKYQILYVAIGCFFFGAIASAIYLLLLSF